jgi:ribosomal protein S18 acetylase RimI-like enzyme
MESFREACVTACISYRTATAADMPLLLDIYSQVRLPELASVEWSDAQKKFFLHTQFEIQQRYFQQTYGDDEFLLILLGDAVAGRLYIGRWAREIRIIDISLLPQYRGRGTGTRILLALAAEAERFNKFVSLHVEKNNPAFQLYRRLGFHIVADTGVYWRMHRHPHQSQAS